MDFREKKSKWRPFLVENQRNLQKKPVSQAAGNRKAQFRKIHLGKNKEN